MCCWVTILHPGGLWCSGEGVGADKREVAGEYPALYITGIPRQWLLRCKPIKTKNGSLIKHSSRFLLQLLLAKNLETVLALSSVCTSSNDRIPLATSLLQIFRHERQEAHLLKTLNDLDMEKEGKSSKNVSDLQQHDWILLTLLCPSNLWCLINFSTREVPVRGLILLIMNVTEFKTWPYRLGIHLIPWHFDGHHVNGPVHEDDCHVFCPHRSSECYWKNNGKQTILWGTSFKIGGPQTLVVIGGRQITTPN